MQDFSEFRPSRLWKKMPTERRVAAAEALRAGISSGERERLRFAAERCAEPTARKALLRIATVQDDTLEEDDEEEQDERRPARAKMG